MFAAFITSVCNSGKKLQGQRLDLFFYTETGMLKREKPGQNPVSVVMGGAYVTYNNQSKTSILSTLEPPAAEV